MTLKQRLATRSLLVAPGPRVIPVDDMVGKGRMPVPLYDFTDLSLLMGFQDVWDFDKDHA